MVKAYKQRRRPLWKTSKTHELVRLIAKKSEIAIMKMIEDILDGRQREAELCSERMEGHMRNKRGTPQDAVSEFLVSEVSAPVRRGDILADGLELPV
jgi:hypothetical protein